MIENQEQLLHFLDVHSIQYQCIAHPAVYTCEQADLYRPALDGVSTKNLFLRDKKGTFYLVMTECARQIDLKALGQSLRTSKLHFGSEELLMELLGVGPGAVTVLGLVNDTAHCVYLVVDSAIWNYPYFLCHPLVNTATLVLSKADLERFFSLTDHVAQIMVIPERGGARGA